CVQRTLAPLQRSVVQALPSSVHGVAPLATTSGGQSAVDPEQCSATSHSPAVARHTVVLGWKPSAGQPGALPVHVSATSHGPALVRHSAPAARNVQVFVQHEVGVPFAAPASHCSWFAGCTMPLPHAQAGSGECPHTALDPSHRSSVQGLPSSVQPLPPGCMTSAGHAESSPVQCSVTSHSPAAARQTVVLGSSTSSGHAAPVPVQCSTTSQTPAADRQMVVLGANASSGQVPELPVHASSESHGPAPARHTPPAVRNVQVPVQHEAAVPLAGPSSHCSSFAGCTMPLPHAHTGSDVCRQTAVVPSQRSSVQALPSSVQPIPSALRTSAGQAGVEPVHVSARSHSPAAGRHGVLASSN